MRNNEIYEDAFDSLKLSSDEIMQDIIDDNIPDLVDGYEYKIHLFISGIVPEIRKPDIFFYKLQKFDKIMNNIINQSIIFEDYSPCVYSVNENDLVIRSKWFTRYNNIPVNNALYTNSYGQKIFNDLKIVNNDDLMLKYAKNFSFEFQCNINPSKSNIINLLKFIKITILKVAQKCFEHKGKSKCKVFSVWIRKTTADENSKKKNDYFGQASSYLENVINKKDDKATRNVIKRLNKFILGNDNNPKIDKWFSTSTVSSETQDIIKYLNLKVTDVYVDEDDTSVRIEVPNKVTMRTWNICHVYDMIKNTQKYFCFTINGKILISLNTYNDNFLKIQKFINDCIYPNVNQMVLTGTMMTDTEYRTKCNTVDLSRLYINDLKVKLDTPYYRKESHFNKWNIKLNTSAPPKKYKETIK